MKAVAIGALAFVLAVAGSRFAHAAEVRLIEDFDATWKEGRWQFSSGAEFPGAKGTLSRSKEAAHGGEHGARLGFDFRGGGNYVAAALPLADAPPIRAVRVRVRKPRGTGLTFRYTDPTGQTLQKPFDAPAGTWTDVLIRLSGWTGHWGGAGDGRIHGPPTMIALLAENSGPTQGAVYFDDVRLVLGEPGPEIVTEEVVAARFAPDEQWRLSSHGNRGTSSLAGRTWRFDFTKGAERVGIVPKEYSLIGLPKRLRLRARGAAPAHPVRVQFATHFMTFEKTVGAFKAAADGHVELTFAAPPGEGWTWHGGENDGRVHGPLRLRGIWLEAAGTKDAGELELVDIRCQAQCPPERRCIVRAERRGDAFVATVRCMTGEPMPAAMHWTVRDWSGKAVASDSATITLGAGAEPIEVSVPVPPPGHTFLEAEFSLDAPDQVTPPALAYYAAPVEGHGTAERDPASPFGMGLYLYRYPGNEAGLAEMDRAATMAQAAGVKWSREEFGWGRVEPRRGQFDWTFYDRVVATAKRHGIAVYGLLAYWSGWTKPYTPEGMEDYCRYAAACVRRYRDDIRHWEVWNEPNIFFWKGPRDMYADLLKRAYAAIKEANPQAQVLGISTAGIDTKFIERTMALGAPFDILTIHPYRRSLDDERFVEDLKKAADLVRRPDGTAREVWITEMGWATHVAHNAIGKGFQVTSQRDQAQLVARAYLDAVASGAAPNISWYDFRNDGRDPFNFEHNMGIVTRDFEPKPAYRAFATMTRILGDARFDRTVDFGPDVVAYWFDRKTAGAGCVLVVWPADRDRTVTVKVSADLPVPVIDLMGNRRVMTPKGGELPIPMQAETPVFLLLEK